jgi:glutamyl/glutaminyl-tRNA synthetase
MSDRNKALSDGLEVLGMGWQGRIYPQSNYLSS